MADSKITALASIGTGTDPANDPLVIVDVSDVSPGGMSATGTTKKVTLNNLLACSPTATLASATISGDLTVATDALKVNSSTKDICIGTTTPTFNNKLTVVGGAGGDAFITSGNGTRTGYIGTDGTNVIMGAYSNHPLRIHVNDYPQMEVAALGVFNWYDGAGGTRMTLNATGLGVGGSPTRKLSIVGSGNTYANINSGDNTSLVGILLGGSSSPSNGQLIYDNTANSMALLTAGNTRLTIDSSGNVGIGVTPITSHILSSAGPIGISGTNSGTRTSYISNSGACSIYYTDGGGSGFFADFGNLIIQPRTSAARSVVIATGSTTPVERAVVKSTGQVRFVPLASDPAGAEAGDVYYNSTSNKLKCYNGTTWNDLF